VICESPVTKMRRGSGQERRRGMKVWVRTCVPAKFIS